MKVKSESQVVQSCPTLCDPMDCSLPGSSTHGIFQARVLEWGAIAFSWHTPHAVWCQEGGTQRKLTASGYLAKDTLLTFTVEKHSKQNKGPIQ